ncbi:MAG: tRNA dihydrouridine(20/20a) synthase DusA [Hyphomicrobiales bacterium]
MYRNALKNKTKMFSVAPMMDWTDRHCRYLHRTLTKQALLYTEMVTADAVIHGQRERLIGFSKQEHPLAIQLGGSDPNKLQKAAKIAEDFGYDEVNLNVGCPSDRVQNGTFGACLMRDPQLVADCVDAMKQAVSMPVTVKCRIGVDDQEPEEALNKIADDVFTAGCDALWVHARKAWLQGLSPKENRDVPPLDYGLVYALKERLSDRFIGINGGIATLDDAEPHLKFVDGVMLGRAAYHDASLLADVDQRIYGVESDDFDWNDVLETMMAYCAEQQANGFRLSAITRHMIGLFHGRTGAKRYRQILSEEARLDTATQDILRRAFAVVMHELGDQDDA